MRPTTQVPPPPRQGPRPLPLHLANQLLTLMVSHAALPNWSNGSLPWKPQLAAAADALRRQAADVDPASFAASVEAEATRRIGEFLRGIEIYRHHHFRRSLAEPPAVWRCGSTRLLDYGGAGPPVLLIPSLVNRAYILDLSERRSVARFLAAHGLRPYLIDWGEPGATERSFALGDYLGRLQAALDVVVAVGGQRPALLGYCMGGLMALALAAVRPDLTKGLALLATPWDFHAAAHDARLLCALEEVLSPLIEVMGQLPVDALQTLFTAVDPTLAARKFRQLANLDPDGEPARDFVLVEDWVNDGVPLVGPVARECLFGWYVRNEPARGEWRVGGLTIRPEDVHVPALAMVPQRDRLVPPDSALALAAVLPKAQRRTVATGHIGMVAGRRALAEVYGPLAAWLSACCAAP